MTILLLLAGIVTLRCWVLPRTLPPGTITYRGEEIRLSKYYFDYDDYKNDPDNIAAEDRARAAQLVLAAPIARTFSTRLELIKATSKLKFPGYGAAQFGDVPLPDGSSLTGYSVEVPALSQDRILIFRGEKGAYTLVDDFVAPLELGILGVGRSGNELVFTDFQKRAVLRRPLPDS